MKEPTIKWCDLGFYYCCVPILDRPDYSRLIRGKTLQEVYEKLEEYKKEKEEFEAKNKNKTEDEEPRFWWEKAN